MYEVDFLSILSAGVVSLLSGFIWYHPRVFGGVWIRLSQITPESVEKGKRRMAMNAVLALIASMIAAYVMNYFGIAWGVYDAIGAVELAFWCWIGFVVPTMLGSVLWDHRPLTLYFIHIFHWLVAFILMAIVLVF